MRTAEMVIIMIFLIVMMIRMQMMAVEMMMIMKVMCVFNDDDTDTLCTKHKLQKSTW